VFIVCNVSFIVRVALCAVFCLSVVCYSTCYVKVCVFCLIAVTMPLGKNQVAFQLNNNHNNNNWHDVARMIDALCYKPDGNGFDSR
jgi:hypothetical protein